MKNLLSTILISIVSVGFGQTLQSVTDSGNTTTNKIGIKNSSPSYFLDHKVDNNILGIEKILRVSTYGGNNYSRRYSLEVLGNGSNVNDFYEIYGGALHTNSSYGNPIFASYGNWSGFAWEWRGSATDNLTLYGFESSTTGDPATTLNSIVSFNAVSGNVGIGTTDPVTKLETSGTIRITSTTPVLHFKESDVVNNNFQVDVSGGNFNIRTNNDSFNSASTKFTITDSGTVGVGISNPTETYNLQVQGTSDFKNTVSFNNSNEGKIGWGSGAGGPGNFFGIIAAENRAFSIGSNNTWDRLVIRPDGNIGIGTDSPNSKLTIKDSNSSIDVYGDSGGNTYLRSNSGEFRFRPNGSTVNKVSFSSTQNYFSEQVGIGTTNTFGYKLAVNGTIGSKEVKVESSSDWPDFVFNPEYSLRTLEEVEKHIKENGHLPEIPTAAEVTEKGVLLGEMNAKLLQKIEELTLYLIEQNKELKALKSKNEELEQRLEKVEN